MFELMVTVEVDVDRILEGRHEAIFVDGFCQYDVTDSAFGRLGDMEAPSLAFIEFSVMVVQSWIESSSIEV